MAVQRIHASEAACVQMRGQVAALFRRLRNIHGAESAVPGPPATPGASRCIAEELTVVLTLSWHWTRE